MKHPDRPIGESRRSASAPHLSYRDVAATGSEPRDTPVLLLHGVGSSSATWTGLLPHLAGRRLIAPDYRGHGGSDAPEPPYQLADFVQDAVRLLDELSLPEVDVVGFSIGALFAAKLALDAPDRVSSLVLLNSIAARTSEQQVRARSRLSVIRESDPAEVAAASAHRWFSPQFLAENPSAVQAEIDIVSAVRREPYAASYAVLVENDLIDEVHKISCPTLIMTGEFDEGSTPAMSRALHDRIERSTLHILAGVKHYAHIEAAPAVGAHITQFWSAVAQSAPHGGVTESIEEGGRG